MSITAEFLVRFKGRQIGSQGVGVPQFDAAIEHLLQFTDGVTANKANLLYAAERTIADGANDDIDLAGALADAFGATIAGAELVGLIVLNKPVTPGAAANTTNLTIGVGTNPVTPGFLGGTAPTIGPIRPGGIFMMVNPDASGMGAIAGGASDILRIANSAGAAAKVQIGVLARNA